jgi:SAM-dependent methyltransferase
VRRYATNKDVLDFGCSDGWLSLELNLPQRCRSLTGIDISDVAIAKATEKCDRAGLTNTRFLVMNAEAMSFPDQSFDVVFGQGILHHLDLDKALSEVARVLRKGGIAIFTEPMGHNPVINLYRRLTPKLRSDDEHPLHMADLLVARRHFEKVELTFYGLFSLASVLIDARPNGISYRVGKALDDALLRLPLIRRYAWQCLIECQHPYTLRNQDRSDTRD